MYLDRSEVAASERFLLLFVETHVILSVALPCHGRRLAPFLGATSAPRRKEGGGEVVTYSELFLLMSVIISLVSLVYQVTKKK